MIEVFDDIEQGSPAWFELRRGIPTASKFKDVLAKGQLKMRTSYLNELVGERISGLPSESYTNADMARGKALEPDARRLYAFLSDNDPKQVGFVRNDRIGCSPDSLIGDDGALEIKTSKPSVLIPLIQEGVFPTEYRAQCQGTLLVTERMWVDLIVYWPNMPAFIIREHRNDAFLQGLRQELDGFCAELDVLEARIRAYQPRSLKQALTGSLA